MNTQFIFSGLLIFILGVIGDIELVLYSYYLILIGTIVTLIGTVKWLWNRNNRKSVKEIFTIQFVPTAFFEAFYNRDISKLLTFIVFCFVCGMLIVHIGTISLKLTPGFKNTIKKLNTDSTIIEMTGGIETFSYLVSGSYSSKGVSKFDIGVIGVKNNVRITVKGHNRYGEYYLDDIEFK